jgi:hypothetical protein
MVHTDKPHYQALTGKTQDTENNNTTTRGWAECPLASILKHVARDISSVVLCTCPPLSAFVGFGPVFTRTIC